MYATTVANIQAKCPEWKYLYFNDDNIIKFFQVYPIDGFPNIIQKFLSIKSGPHKADLFRYYFLYVFGGVYVDSDATLEVDIDSICKDYEFFSANSTYFENTIFQGLIGSVPKNEIILKALTHIYTIDNKVLEKDYFAVIKALYLIVKSQHYNFKIGLYAEINNDAKSAKVVDGTRTILIHHYGRKEKYAWYPKRPKLYPTLKFIKHVTEQPYDL
jgi:hypothetical protein